MILPDDNDAKNRSTSALQRALASAPVTLFTLDPEGRILLIEGSDRARLVQRHSDRVRKSDDAISTMIAGRQMTLRTRANS